MAQAGNLRGMAMTAAVAVLGGISLVIHGVLYNSPASRVAPGVCLTMIGLSAGILLTVRRWITETSQERQLLAAAQHEAQAQRDRYFAAQAALDCEQSRFTRDMAAERAALDARLKVERKAMEAEFEEQKATLVAETMEATFLMYRDGKFAPEVQQAGTVISFPRQHPEPQAQRERSRGHGVVGP